MLQVMKKIQVVGPRADLNRAVDLLYTTGTVHLENAAERVPAGDIGLSPVQVEQADEITDVLGKIGTIFSTLPPMPEDPVHQEEIRRELGLAGHENVIGRARAIIRELEDTTRTLTAKKRDLALSIAALDRYAKVLAIIQPVEKELPALEGFEVTILLIEKEHAEVIDLIRKELGIITRNQFEMSSMTVDAETLATLMVFPRRYSETVHSFIYSVNVNEVRLPREYTGRPFYEMFALIEEQKLAAQDEISATTDRLANLSRTWYQELSVLTKYLENLHNELGAYRNFGISEYTFVITGWVPKRQLHRTRDVLHGTFSDRVVLTEVAMGREDAGRVPIYFDNPPWAKPFELVMGLVALPKYREVDPSPILAIFFPIFFGIMVGDIGYGLIILAIGLYMQRQFATVPFAKSLAGMLIISSVPAILFGIFFGEFFGNFAEHLGLLHPVHILGITWNRAEAIIPMLILAVAIGVIHVFLGLALGVRNAVILQSRHHLAERSGMILAIAGIILALLATSGAGPKELLYGAAALLIISLPLILYGAGPFGAIEVMSTVGNILSYARLMAIGMASVILAIVANKLAGVFGIAIIGITVAVLLHILNIALAMFSPSIHAIRLHLVEFFSKFYEGGGVPYRPFARSGPAEVSEKGG